MATLQVGKCKVLRSCSQEMEPGHNHDDNEEQDDSYRDDEIANWKASIEVPSQFLFFAFHFCLIVHR